MLSPVPLVPNGSAKKLTITPRAASPRPDVSPFDAKMHKEDKIEHGEDKDKDDLEIVGDFFSMLEKKSSGYLLERDDDLGETGKDSQFDGKEILWEGLERGLGGRGNQGQELIGKGEGKMGIAEVEKFQEHVRGVVSRCTLELEKIEKKSLGEGRESSLERKLTKNLLEFGAVRQSQQIAQEKKLSPQSNQFHKGLVNLKPNIESAQDTGIKLSDRPRGDRLIINSRHLQKSLTPPNNTHRGSMQEFQDPSNTDDSQFLVSSRSNLEFVVGSQENLNTFGVGFKPPEQKFSDAKLENFSPLGSAGKVGVGRQPGYRNYEPVLADRKLVGGGSPGAGPVKAMVTSGKKGKKGGLDMTLPAQAKTSKIKSVVRSS
jgi:hypothetical protein